MDKHYGQIVELVIRKKGYSISELARLSQINRKCVYNWFNQKYLKPEIIYSVGCIIHHDFSVEFPELFTKEDFTRSSVIDSSGKLSIVGEINAINWKDKYIDLLEKYNNLLLKQLENDSQI
ncbi:MAG: hypothetical protein JWP67_55 [Mucilaginibacter sp.]|jgi:lambda repressor-like predicted transcriptional regulator|nr:hypothetical protein [Mucilaginibacter sp.]